MAELPKVVVVLGAGASFDSWNGQVPRVEGWQPPTAAQLFSYRSTFWEVLERYPGAKFLQSALGPLSASGAIKIEEKLSEYARGDDETRRHFKEVPLYIRDVIYGASTKYLPSSGTGTYAHFVSRLLSEREHRVMFLSLNYDTLLEQAIELARPKLAIGSVQDYVDPSRGVSVVKVHGSVNWVRSMGRVTRAGANWDRHFETFDPLRNTDIYLHDVGENSRGATFDADEARWWAYPAITAPVAGKSGRFVCPDTHTDALREFTTNCRKYLFVGTSGLDEDVLTFMAQHVPSGSFASYVGSGSDAKVAAKRIDDAVPAFREDFYRHTVWDDGFAAFAGSDEFDQFLRWPPAEEDIEQFRSQYGNPRPLTSKEI